MRACGELCLNIAKPGETLVEACSDSDVHPDTYIRHLDTYIRYLISYIRHLGSYIRHLGSYIRYLGIYMYIGCPISIFESLCIIFGVLYSGSYSSMKHHKLKSGAEGEEEIGDSQETLKIIL